MKMILVAVAAVVLWAGPVYAQIVQGGIGNDQAAAQQQQQQDQGQFQESTNQQQQGLVNAPATSLTVTSKGGPNFIQLPGFNPAYPNFTQPYKPEVFINGAGPVRPHRMTYAQAKKCRGDAKNDSDDKREIVLFYPAWDKVVPAVAFDGYIGTEKMEESDGVWLEAICKLAKKAMDKGAEVGVIEYIIRPNNRTWGVGGAASFGGSGSSGPSANPYALAGTVGLGTGISGAYVKGDLMMRLTGMKNGSVRSAREGDPIPLAATGFGEK